MNVTMRVTGLVLLAVVAVSCASTGQAPISRGPNVTYMLLSDGSLHRNEPPPATGFYVEGTIARGAFTPTGDVLGSGLVGGDGRPGWLELRDGAFYADDSGRAPVSPYIHGTMGADGVFRPTDHKVIH